MATPSGNVTKSNILGEMQTAVRDPINALSKWTILSNSFGSNVPYPGYSMTSNNYGGVVPLQGDGTSVVTTSPQPTEIPGSTITASLLESVFFNAAVLLSSARQLTLIKTYQVNSSVGQFYNSGVVVGNMASAYHLTLSAFTTPLSGTLNSNTDVENSEIDSLVSSINGILTTHRTSTVNFTEHWCHSSCHSSCHGSRCRR
jgi:hypothetical protein